ncbi:hypothetical protein SGODD07_01570 [Streptococcus gordonii]|uniref:Uncharacterized protein n=1 Tax=Streptococcus gordonii TaxID=1302 RepID=A0A139N3C5_STRGN|nr:hypothetical protein SGODD07_01570 [Streptococcus gordonii]
MVLNPKIEKSLIEINFVERYKKISKKYSRERTPEGEELAYFDGDLLMEIVESLGYTVKYDKRERFFHIDLETVDNFRFGFHFMFRSGRLELIWVVYEGDKVLLGSPWTRYPRLMISRDYIIKPPIISDYDDFEDVMKIAFEMYEDFKQAFLKIAAES